MSKNTNHSHKLMPFVRNAELNDFSDYLFIMAKNIEKAFGAAGATPGEDYSMRDLFEMALPFVLEEWKSGKFEIDTSNF